VHLGVALADAASVARLPRLSVRAPRGATRFACDRDSTNGRSPSSRSVSCLTTAHPRPNSLRALSPCARSGRLPRARQELVWDEQRPSLACGSASAPLPHPWKGSGGAVTARIHATRHSGRRAVAASSYCCFRRENERVVGRRLGNRCGRGSSVEFELAPRSHPPDEAGVKSAAAETTVARPRREPQAGWCGRLLRVPRRVVGVSFDAPVTGTHQRTSLTAHPQSRTNGCLRSAAAACRKRSVTGRGLAGRNSSSPSVAAARALHRCTSPLSRRYPSQLSRRYRVWIRSPWGPKMASASAGPSTAPSQCGTRQENSAASPGSRVKSSSPSTSLSRPERT
jgi:hypothetical protein